MNNLDVRNLVKSKLNDFDLVNTFGQRTVGDALEADVVKIAKEFYDKKFEPASSARSLEDFTIKTDNQIDFFDVKSHHIQEEKGHSMPNLISVKRLVDNVFDNDLKTLSYIFVHYKRDKKGRVSIEDVQVRYIWELDWSILQIGALGTGQIQIKDANKDITLNTNGKKSWYNTFLLEAIKFYKKEIVKMLERIKDMEKLIQDGNKLF